MTRKRMLFLTTALVLGAALGGWLMLGLMDGGGKARVALPLAPPAEEPVTFYRWHDAQGAIHLSSEKPPAGVAYETQTVDGVLSRMDVPPAREDTPAAPIGNPLNVYTPGGMRQLIDQAQQVAEAQRRATEQTQRNLEQQN